MESINPVSAISIRSGSILLRNFLSQTNHSGCHNGLGNNITDTKVFP